MHGEVSTRPGRLPDDGDFLPSVYACTRPELTGPGWPGHHHDAFTRMQSGAQTRHYRESFPDAAHSVIGVDGDPAGRLIVHHAGDQILIIDIALRPQFRRTGTGSALVRRLLERADAGHLPVRCHVLHDSTARRFWEQAGFAAQRSDGVYLAMERPPQARPP
jgi:GNAT superfamily N-acetyltransferase